jgi:lipocalin
MLSVPLLIFLLFVSFIVLVYGIVYFYFLWRPTSPMNREIEQHLQMVNINEYFDDKQWYEIGRIDSSFEPLEATNVTANYSIVKDKDGRTNKIKVTNRSLNSGEWKVAHGIALPGKTTSNGATSFSVSFIPYSLLPISGDYNIVGLLKDKTANVMRYSASVVVGKDLSYLWFLSDRPLSIMNEKEQKQLLVWFYANAEKVGFTQALLKEKKFHLTEQRWPPSYVYQ